MRAIDQVVFAALSFSVSTRYQPGITPRREIDTLVHLTRRVLCDALPDQRVKIRVRVRV